MEDNGRDLHGNLSDEEWAVKTKLDKAVKRLNKLRDRLEKLSKSTKKGSAKKRIKQQAKCTVQCGVVNELKEQWANIVSPGKSVEL